MNEKLELEVQYSVEDFVRGALFSKKRASSNKYIFLFTVILGFFGFVVVYNLFYKGEDLWSIDFLLKILLAFLIIIPFLYILKDFEPFSESLIKKQYNSSPLFQETYKISFEADGINSESASFANEIKWSVIIEAVQTDKDFHFFITPDSSLYIPKRVFTPDRQRELIKLAQIKLGEKAKL